MSYQNPFPEMKIYGQAEAQDIVRAEPDKWNVVSIVSVDGRLYKKDRTVKPLDPPDLQKAKSFISIHIDDIQREEAGLVLCGPSHINEVLKFAWAKRGEPLLVHCYAGISRSSAMMFLILLDNIQKISEFPIDDALGMVRALRPICIPNRHILHLGISMLAGSLSKEISWTRILYNCEEFKKIYG